MRSRYLTKTSILSSESGMPLPRFPSPSCSLRPTPIYFPKSPCAYEPGITPLSKFTCTYEPAVRIPLSLSLRVPTNQEHFLFSKSSRTFEQLTFPLSSSPVPTNQGYFRSPSLLYLRPRTFSGIHVFVQRSVHLWNQWPGMPGRVVEVYAWGDTYFLIRDLSQTGQALVAVYTVNAWGNVYRHNSYNG